MREEEEEAYFPWREGSVGGPGKEAPDRVANQKEPYNVKEEPASHESVNKIKLRFVQEHSAGKEQNDMEAERWIRSQARANWCIVGFTAVLTVVTIWQGVNTYMTLRFAMLQQRAWVVLESVKLSTPLSRTTPLVYSLEFQNVGVSPALDVSVTWMEAPCVMPLIGDEMQGVPDCPTLKAAQQSDWRGERFEKRIVGPEKGYSVPLSFAPSSPPQSISCFCGQLVYTDVSCVSHHRDLCWYYTAKDKQMRFCDVGYTEHDEMGKCYQDQPPFIPPEGVGKQKTPFRGPL